MAHLGDVDFSNTGELMDGFEPFAPGDYVVQLESAERKVTKSGDGEYLKCTFVVAEGVESGRKVFHQFNLWNKSEQARNIAKAELNAICLAALGQDAQTVKDSSLLEFKKFVAEVKYVPEDKEKGYKAKNELVFRKGTIHAVGAAAPTHSAPPAAQTQHAAPTQAASAPASAPAAAGGRPSWAKR